MVEPASPPQGGQALRRTDFLTSPPMTTQMTTSATDMDFENKPELALLIENHTVPGPVGGCLARFLDVWKRIDADAWSINVLQHGYAPSFAKARPPLTRNWRRHESASTPEKSAMLQISVEEMLVKDAVEIVKDKDSLGFYSHMFLVVKKNGKFRPVINLRELNNTLDVPSFKMETVATVSAAVTPGDWAISLDLTDGYFHVPMADWFRKYLRFVVNGVVYQFKALPFGLATAPRVFTKILSPPTVYLHSLGIPLHRFLDDFLCRASCRRQLICWTTSVIMLLCMLGFKINIPKCMLDPTQDFVYIGVRFLTNFGLMTPPDDRIDKILQAIQAVKSQNPAPAKLWLTMLGLMGSAEKQVPLGRLYLRPLQFCLHSQFRMREDSLDVPVSLNGKSLLALEWWSDVSHLSRGQSLGPFDPVMTVFTDSSTTAWGAHADSMMFSGVWSHHERKMSINQLELLAVIRAIEALPPDFNGQRLMIASDNSTTVSYINKLGGTRSVALWELTLQLFSLIQSRNIVIKARHIPGRLNRLADSLSRSGQIVNTEWTLNQQICNQVLLLWGSPTVDMMATSLTRRLPVYVSPFPDPKALYVDAMSYRWTGLDGYIFPPWPMIAPVLQKMKRERCLITAIIPCWPNRPWFPDLLELLVEHPRRLPVFPKLLSMPHNRHQHGALEALSLHACRLSSDPSLGATFLRRCQNASPEESELDPHSLFMTVNGPNSRFGVRAGKWILSLPL